MGGDEMLQQCADVLQPDAADAMQTMHSGVARVATQDDVPGVCAKFGDDRTAQCRDRGDDVRHCATTVGRFV
jgi:hypothetical protein